MNRNVGNVDRIIRIILALVILVMLILNKVEEGTALILGVMAVALIATGGTRVCPCYMRLNIKTNKNEDLKK